MAHREKHFKTTRGALVSELIEAGYNAKIVPNPYNPQRPMWDVEPVDPRMLEIIRSYYAVIGKEPPAFIAEWQRGFDRKDAEKGGTV